MRPEWRLRLHARDGTALADLSTIATGKKLVYPLSRPAQLTFEVPSDDPNVASLHTDDDPYLDIMRRVHGWRKENGTWTHRYAGYVWIVNDKGDATSAKTQVTCFDPLQVMRKRLARNSSNAIPATGLVTFTSAQRGAIIEALVNRTNTGADASGLVMGTVDTTAVIDSVTYEWRTVADIIQELLDPMNGPDLEVVPAASGTTIGTLNVHDRRGQERTDVVLAWGALHANARESERNLDAETLANDVRVIGTDPDAAIQETDATSITRYGRMEAVERFTDITDASLLQLLADTAIALRKDPRELAAFVPQPEPANPTREFSPFVDYDVGDTFRVVAGPRLRGGFTGLQRLYSLQLDIDDNAVERVPALVVSPE